MVSRQHSSARIHPQTQLQGRPQAAIPGRQILRLPPGALCPPGRAPSQTQMAAHPCSAPSLQQGSRAVW